MLWTGGKHRSPPPLQVELELEWYPSAEPTRFNAQPDADVVRLLDIGEIHAFGNPLEEFGFMRGDAACGDTPQRDWRESSRGDIVRQSGTFHGSVHVVEE